ncbi:low-density lipoprotein receptor-related protein 2-like [Toxotes jaculatrix]|uniref:low-density lipoprotein receptor-related protein 2-like n=1 Tax=Toxotes jaculatrix TaxID=941984 RepID=UPI001B3A9EC2|nr:low-density lipoprotein receptor-related protein 2-like [Toxotes jaculatrix]
MLSLYVARAPAAVEADKSVSSQVTLFVRRSRVRADMGYHRFIYLFFLASLRVSGGQQLGCRQGLWQCDDGSCIPDIWRCDGDGDCLDGSDEMDCTGSSECPPGQFPCLDSVGCVNATARCDGQNQCPTGSDEENCTAPDSCLDSDWTCQNHMCIPKELHCNGLNDCMDNSDEGNCGPCGKDSIRCPDGTCLSPEERCDGRVDCSDGSDEPITCGRICSMNNGSCSHVCVDEPWGALCACPVGYKLSANGAICEDLDECASPFSPCMHHCTNTIGSYYCHCRDGFKLNGSSVCLATGNATRLLIVQRRSIGLLNVKSQQFQVTQTPVLDPVALTFDVAHGWYFWADSQGSIYKSDGQHSWITYTGEPGIRGLACDWLNGNLYWTNQKMESIYMQAADGNSYTTLLSKDISPSDLVLIPVESLMFWTNAGPGDRVTIEKSWMDGSERSSLTVLTAQSAHSLTADVAARRLYWISDFRKSIETVKVDGSGRYSFTGLFSRRPALSLAVFEGFFYWVDDRGLWQVPQNQPNQRKFLWKAELPLTTVYHELQQPQGSSACVKTPCHLCQLTKGNPVGFTCACPDFKVLLLDGTCEYPRFIYATITNISLLEFRGKESTQTQLFTTDNGILSFDLDWSKDWLYWANQTGHIQRTSLTQVKTEVVPTPFPVCLIKVDPRSGSLYWVSCDQNSLGTTAADSRYTQQLYHTTKEIRDLYLDWLRGGILWLEEEQILAMSMMGGKPKELLQLAGGVIGNIAFDLRANSLLWNSKRAGLTTMSLLRERNHQAGRRWIISGSVVAAFEPFLLSLSDDVMILWDRRDGRPIQDVTVKGHMLSVIAALRDVRTVPSAPVCSEPSMLCRHSPVCLSQAQLCDGKKDCPDGDDEDFCVTTCPSKEDFKCKDHRNCVTRNLVCDGRSHCRDGSDEVDCPTVAPPAVPANVLECHKGSMLCKDSTQCVLYSHVCDGESDCKDGSDELGCDATAQTTTPNRLNISSSNEMSPSTAPPAVTLPACSSPSVLCPSLHLCISPSQFCNGRKDCPDGFDEKNCVKKCPSKNHFRCKDSQSCVPKSLVCDGRSHCHDGSDEVDCPSVAPPTARAKALKCRMGSRLCRDGSECVLFSHVCDGENDCRDGSDEEGCAQANVLKCRMGSRPCNDGAECVLYSHLCDGENDCMDGSDEQGCPETCKQGEFQCSHGKMCIPAAQVCDGKSQCQDRSDELDCWERTKSCEHRCSDGQRCIPEKFLCDGERDCLDGTDEVGCDPTTASTTTELPLLTSTSACITPSVRCPGSSLCISQNQLCDGPRDCPDGFDELDCVVQCENQDDFLCSDRRKCVPRMEVCDGRAHCPDGSDEKQCQSADPTALSSINLLNARAAPLRCRIGFKPCKDGLDCVMYSHVCDGEKDCQDGSDEEGCAAQCKAGEFRCSHGNRCIPPQQVCDGQYDCQDRSDEMGCSRLSEGCHQHCDNNTRCIPETFLCDGERDCTDGSDEEKCGLVACAINQYRCASGQCVSEALRCDGYTDCSDHSDEMDCTRPPRCPGQLQCPHSHECLQKEWLCDGEDDCKDGSDERDCVTPPAKCREYQWQCGDSSQCIPLSWRCDGKKDCHNGVDEEKCRQRKCPSHLYQCGSGECVDPGLVCNSFTNCADSSDEGMGCAKRNCSSSSAPQCDHHCVSTPKGPRCYCAVGFRLQSSAVSCVDVDECNALPQAVCRHKCLNTRGSYVCHCHPGFFLEPDNKSCKTKDEPLLLASVQSELLLLGVHSSNLRLLSSASRPVFSLDYDWAQHRVYWLSPNYQSIRWTDMKNSNNKGTLIKGVKSDFIAVDWVGKNLYWVDGLVGQILAVKLSDATVRSQDYTVVLGEDLEQPSSLVLLPHRGLMLWSEIGSTPQIELSGMDGSKRKVVVSRGLSWPVSLAYDLLDNRVYWADEKLRCIGSASLDGDNVKILQLAETPSPFSVAVFNDRVFWSDTKRRTIRSADKNTGKDQKVLLKRPGQPFALKLMHALSQPATSSPCDQMRCSHLCLLSPAVKGRSGTQGSPVGPVVRGLTAVCRCPKGLLLSKDKITCSLPVESTFILLLSHTTVYQIYLHSIHRDGVALKKMPNSRVLALPGVTEALGLDVSIKELSLFVADARQGSVDVLKLSSSRSRQGLTPTGQILKLKDDVVTALAVDWVTSNLYWSSTERPDLHVTSRHNGYTTSLLQGSLKGTTSIALYPPSGRLCYTAIVAAGGKSQTEVNCVWMDGRNKAVLWRKSSIPTSLVFSNKGTMIYWADTGEGVISSIGVDGSGYKQYKAGPGLLIAFTHTENILLWVTLDKDVTKMWFSDGLQPKQLWFETKTILVEVRAYSNSSQSGTNSCSNNNGDCVHLCLPYPGGRTCKCGRAFYSVNATSCAHLPECPTGEQSCFDGSRCISSSKFCDGHGDCPDQSDEQDCPNKNSAPFGAKASDDHLPQSSSSSSSADSVPSVKKGSTSCDVQKCNGHGNCITEGEVVRCLCLAGYKGEFCQETESGRGHAAVILGVFCLVAALMAAAFIFAKRRAWASIRSRSMEKETLMADMGLPCEHYDSDSEELESPVDLKNPPLVLKTLHPK